MSYKIILDGTYVMWTTKCEVSDDSEPDTTNTHSGPIITDPPNNTYTIKVERATKYEYGAEQEIYDILQKAKHEPITMVYVKEQNGGGIRATYTGCRLSSNKEEVDENGEFEFTFELLAITEDKEFYKV